MLNEKFEVVRNSRLVLGISVLLIALLSAGLISKEANRTVQVWAAGSNLSPGSFLSDTDIQKFQYCSQTPLKTIFLQRPKYWAL